MVDTWALQVGRTLQGEPEPVGVEGGVDGPVGGGYDGVDGYDGCSRDTTGWGMLG